MIWRTQNENNQQNLLLFLLALFQSAPFLRFCRTRRFALASDCGLVVFRESANDLRFFV